MKFSTLLSLLVALILSPASSANGLLVPRDGSPPIAIESHRVQVLVENGLARTTVRQTFINPHRRPLEALYVFALPESAALTEVAMEVGGKRLEGLLAERKRARKVYDEIVNAKRDPALVEQIGRSSFRLSVFPVMPDQETVVELSWIEQVPLGESAFQYVYPLATGGKEQHTEQDFQLTAVVRSAVPIVGSGASSADIELVQRSPYEVLAAVERSSAVLDQDIVITAEIETPVPSVAWSTFRDDDEEGFREDSEEGWFQLLITPPHATEEQLIPRDVILVLDTSGSMKEDGKIEQARAAALWLLEHLRAVDRVNVVRFSSDVQSFAKQPVPATRENLDALAGFVRGFKARGGTALGDALKALTEVPEEAGRARTVVLLSDGRPTIGEDDSEKLIELARASGEGGLRIYPFGVGEDLDSALLHGIAAAGSGEAQIFRPGGEIATRMTTFLTRTSAPVMSNIELSIDGVAASAIATHDILPRTLPDAYLGEQLSISGRFRGAGEATVTVSATLGGERKSFVQQVQLPDRPTGSASVKQLFAREKLDYLEQALRLRSGLDDAAYFAALDEGAYSTRDEIVQEMIDVSIEHGVQCAYTSFLVLLPEDRARIDPRDAEALAAALERAGDRADSDLAAQSSRQEEPLEEVVLMDLEIDFEDDPDFVSDSPFDDQDFNDQIGIGGGAGGSYGQRFGSRTKLATTPAVNAGLQWLADHQDADGKWDSDGFTKHCRADDPCAGTGEPGNDVGVTGLALLAFMGEGHTTRTGAYKENVRRGFEWLRQSQDFETGLLGDQVGHTFLYNHAIATQALCEAYYFSKSPLLRGTAQKAVKFLVRARNPYGAWRYDVPPTGDNDTSVTGWCAMALKTAQDAGLEVDRAAFSDTLSWLDEVTDVHNGRIGYDSPGSRSSRVMGVNDEYATDRAETMTAVGLALRFFLGQDPAKHPLFEKHAALILESLPEWSAKGHSNDMIYWLFGSYAMYQTGGEAWLNWNAALEPILIDHQQPTGCGAGSWEPSGPWGYSGGRIYTTACSVMCLEVTYRYAKIVGGR